jgi:hypothetical protein
VEVALRAAAALLPEAAVVVLPAAVVAEGKNQ